MSDKYGKILLGKKKLPALIGFEEFMVTDDGGVRYVVTIDEINTTLYTQTREEISEVLDGIPIVDANGNITWITINEILNYTQTLEEITQVDTGMPIVDANGDITWIPLLDILGSVGISLTDIDNWDAAYAVMHIQNTDYKIESPPITWNSNETSQHNSVTNTRGFIKYFTFPSDTTVSSFSFYNLSALLTDYVLEIYSGTIPTGEALAGVNVEYISPASGTFIQRFDITTITQNAWAIFDALALVLSAGDYTFVVYRKDGLNTDIGYHTNSLVETVALGASFWDNGITVSVSGATSYFRFILELSGGIVESTSTGTYIDGTIVTIANWNTAYGWGDHALAGYINQTEKGSNNGVAELDASGFVPAAQLPSYVDDVEEYANLASFPTTGESGKIYIALDTNRTYRWSGTVYVELSTGVVLGETSTTAYRGDRGKIAYDHSQVTHAPSDADNTANNETSHADVVVDGDFTVNGFMERTASGVYTVKPFGIVANTIAEGNHIHASSAISWIEPTFAGTVSGTADVNGSPKIQYRLTSLGVQVVGGYTKPSGETDLFTLPVGLRPSQNIRLPKYILGGGNLHANQSLGVGTNGIVYDDDTGSTVTAYVNFIIPLNTLSY